jgi:hypothetical protein
MKMTRMTLAQFTRGMELLAAVYGTEYPVFTHPDIAEIWFEFFASKYSNQKFLQMIKHYLAVCHWFPRVPNDICKIWEESGEERRPGENWRSLLEETLASLPSSESQQKLRESEEIKNLSPEQIIENQRRLALLQAIACNLRSIKAGDKSKIESLTFAPIHELEAIARTCEKAKLLSVQGNKHGVLEVSPNALFEDMQKYFHSGSEKYRQVAINWAANPKNGCELVKLNGRVVDIRQVDF